MDGDGRVTKTRLRSTGNIIKNYHNIIKRINISCLTGEVEAAEVAAAAIKSPRVVGANDERASGRGVCVVLYYYSKYI